MGDQFVGQVVAMPPADDEPPARPKPFPMMRAGELEPSLECHDFVEDLLTDGGMSVVYGPSNVGKSFWALDIAAHVASGAPWRFGEHAVEQGAVLYIALEGTQGIRNRVASMIREEILADNDPLYVVFSQVSLLKPEHVESMRENVRVAREDCGDQVRLVVIDTLSRALAGGDENGSRDMTFAVAGVDEIRRDTGAHVMLVHHCGKDEAKGARGHSSLRAAADTEVELHQPEGESCITATVRKQKDLRFAGPFPFSLKVIELGENRRGKPVTSCVVKQEDEVMAASRSGAGRPPAVDGGELLNLLPQDSTKAWQKAADEEHGVSKSAFYRHLKKLQGHGAIKTTDGKWLRQ